MKYNPGKKSLKVSFIVYTDLECMFEKPDTCQNNPKKHFSEKEAEHIPSGYSWVISRSFDKLKPNGFITEENTVWK